MNSPTKSTAERCSLVKRACRPRLHSELMPAIISARVALNSSPAADWGSLARRRSGIAEEEERIREQRDVSGLVTGSCGWCNGGALGGSCHQRTPARIANPTPHHQLRPSTAHAKARHVGSGKLPKAALIAWMREQLTAQRDGHGRLEVASRALPRLSARRRLNGAGRAAPPSCRPAVPCSAPGR